MLDFTEEQRLAQSAIRSWCAQHLEPNVRAMEAGTMPVYPTMRAMADTFGIPDMARAGFARMREPRPETAAPRRPGRAGGGDGQAAMMAILMMELSRCCPGFALAFGATLGLFGGAVMARGTMAQKEAWALPVLTMEKIGAWALTEPGAGSDAFGSMRTTARRVDGGWLVKGSKTFITNAPFADSFVVYAKTGGGGGGEQDVRAFLVARESKGVATSAPFAKMGMHASPTGELFLDEVFVPSDALLGGEETPTSRAAAKASLSNERFGMTPMCLGMLERCLDESVKYAKERTQWGKPIASYQLVQEKIARMYTARTIVRTLLLRQLEAEREGAPLTAEEASATKLYCARATTDCALEAVQIMGGAGYMTGSVVEMMARDAKLFQIGGGTDEIQILRIAREVLGG
jgi:alkylation response protein AidB-like acyl-CoA dehydrogenase